MQAFGGTLDSLAPGPVWTTILYREHLIEKEFAGRAVLRGNNHEGNNAERAGNPYGDRA
jgi:hypothetical protein